MDIQRLAANTTSKLKTKAAPVSGRQASFSEMLTKQNETGIRLQSSIQKIQDQGRLLSETRTFKELRTYKQMVKSFMEETLNSGLHLEERSGFNRRSQMKVYKIVTKVDQKLVQLTDDILKQEAKQIDILDQIGEIKGLLMNIYK